MLAYLFEVALRTKKSKRLKRACERSPAS